MDAITHFFQVDIPAVFSAGKYRLALIQLNSQLSQLEKQKGPILKDLGAKAWEGGIRDARYAAIYGKLEELDASVKQTQNEMDELQKSLSQETNNLSALIHEFNGRLKEVQDQRQPVMEKLRTWQAKQTDVEKRLNRIQATTRENTALVRNMEIQAVQLHSSDQPEKDARIASLHSTIGTVKSQMDAAVGETDAAKKELESICAAKKPLEDQIAGYDQLIKMMQDQHQTSVAPIQEKIKNLKQNSSALSGKKAGINQKILDLMPEFGKEVNASRPPADLLSPIYGKVDAVDREIKEVNDQINMTNARLASIGRGSVRRVVITGVALLLLLVLMAACIIGIVLLAPTIAGAIQQ
jgi:chromosome segregation ATPase